MASQMWLVTARLQAVQTSISVNFDAPSTAINGSVADADADADADKIQGNVRPLRKRPE